MLLSAVSVLIVAQSSSEIPEGLMNNPVYVYVQFSSSSMRKQRWRLETSRSHFLSHLLKVITR